MLGSIALFQTFTISISERRWSNLQTLHHARDERAGAFDVQQARLFQRGEVDAAPLGEHALARIPLRRTERRDASGRKTMGIFSSELSIVSQPPTAGEISHRNTSPQLRPADRMVLLVGRTRGSQPARRARHDLPASEEPEESEDRSLSD